MGDLLCGIKTSWVRAFGTFLLICLLAIPTQGLEISGYYENDIVGVVKRDGGLAAGDLSRLRLKIDAFNIHLEPRYYFLLKSESLPLTGVSGLDQLVWDKYYFKTKLPLFSITAGKQRIAWGTGYLWNPTDIFNPFVLSFAVKEEEETKVEAIRVEVPVGVAAGIDSYVVTGSEWVNARKGIRGKTNIGLFDLSLSYVDQGSGSYQLGFDSVGELLGIGVRNEIAVRPPASGNGYIQSVWGWDYTFENGIYLTMEYFFNGLGKKNRAEYDWNAVQKGMDYAYFGMNKIINEITQVKGAFLANLNDQSFILYPSYTRNVMQNLDLSLEAMLVGGVEGSEYYPAPAQDVTGLGGSKLILARGIYSF